MNLAEKLLPAQYTVYRNAAVRKDGVGQWEVNETLNHETKEAKEKGRGSCIF